MEVPSSIVNFYWLNDELSSSGWKASKICCHFCFAICQLLLIKLAFMTPSKQSQIFCHEIDKFSPSHLATLSHSHTATKSQSQSHRGLKPKFQLQRKKKPFLLASMNNFKRFCIQERCVFPTHPPRPPLGQWLPPLSSPSTSIFFHWLNSPPPIFFRHWWIIRFFETRVICSMQPIYDSITATKVFRIKWSSLESNRTLIFKIVRKCWLSE